MWIKAFIAILFIFVLFNLFRALPALLKNGERESDDTDNKSSKPSQPLSHFLGKRLLLSIIIFMIVMLAVFTGVITPNPRPY